MHIAYTMAPGQGDTDILLHTVAQSLIKAGHRPVGTAQINTERPDAGPCDMDVVVLPHGPKVRISQSLGRQARGCRLDPEALETAVGLVQSRLPNGDCLIVNKFGKHEAEGRGFRTTIAQALAHDLPVLVGLNALNADAFHEFCEGLAVGLEPDHDVILPWIRTHLRAKADAA